jgi:IS1 family transposase
LSGRNGTCKPPKKLSDFGVSYGNIATDDWNSFVTAFKGENHLIGKKYTVGIRGIIVG